VSNGNTNRELFQLRSVQSIDTLPSFGLFYHSIFDLVRDFMKDEAFSQQDHTVRKCLKPDLFIIDNMSLKPSKFTTTLPFPPGRKGRASVEVSASRLRSPETRAFGGAVFDIRASVEFRTVLGSKLQFPGQTHNFTPCPEPLRCIWCRIAQEALYNARKHSRATLVSIFLNWGMETISLTISDNGQGFLGRRPKAPTEGFGLS
jgi:hypothetical protein